MSRRKRDAEELKRLQLQIKKATNSENVAVPIKALEQRCTEMLRCKAYSAESDRDIYQCIQKTRQQIHKLGTYDVTRKQLCEFTIQALIDALLYEVPDVEVET